MQGEGGVGDSAVVAEGADQQRQEVVKPEGALEAVLEVAEQADEDRFHGGNKERPLAEEALAVGVVVGVEHRVHGAESQDGVQNRLVGDRSRQIDERVSDAETEPPDAR